jgi:hypothetical protein
MQMGGSSSRDRDIQTEQKNVDHRMKNDSMTKELKKLGCTESQIKRKYRQDYNNPSWKKDKDKDRYLYCSLWNKAEKKSTQPRDDASKRLRPKTGR